MALGIAEMTPPVVTSAFEFELKLSLLLQLRQSPGARIVVVTDPALVLPTAIDQDRDPTDEKERKKHGALLVTLAVAVETTARLAVRIHRRPVLVVVVAHTL